MNEDIMAELHEVIDNEDEEDQDIEV